MVRTKDVLDIAKNIIDENIEEFSSMFHGRDPRHGDIEWITVDDVLSIHNEIIDKLNGRKGVHNLIDLKYAVDFPIMNIEGCPPKPTFEKICNCAYLLGRCFVDCGAQVAATVFCTLCKKNNYEVKFKLGDIYDIFSKTIGPNIEFSEFHYSLSELTKRNF